MANQTSFNYCMPLAGTCVPGRILVDYENGNAEWFAGGDTFPTFESSENTGGVGNWGWTPSTSTSIENLRNNGYVTAKGLIYPNDQALLKDFYTGNSISGLNSQRAAAFNNNLPGQGTSLGVPGTRNTAPPPPAPPAGAQSPSASGLSTSTSAPKNPLVTDIEGKTKQSAGAYKSWVYPTDLSNNQQDYIHFSMIEYGGRELLPFSIESGSLGSRRKFGRDERGNLKILGTVTLPIQPTITDVNSVDWQNDTLNPLELVGAEVSLDTISGTLTVADAQALFAKATDPKVKSYLQQWLAGKSIGKNIFGRFSGAVVNPNMELLFNGPQLRPFNFTFRLSPRDEKEADQVKGIIRFFKQGMAIRRTDNQIFLKAPNVFNIKYMNGMTGGQHTSIGKIKTCALSQCIVDYTPDGSYATFYDAEATMTQYSMTLQFNELEPIFNEDYGRPGQNPTIIGY